MPTKAFAQTIWTSYANLITLVIFYSELKQNGILEETVIGAVYFSIFLTVTTLW